jgi:hypothetical protein
LSFFGVLIAKKLKILKTLAVPAGPAPVEVGR